MIVRNSEGSIGLRCDTPLCSAFIQTPYRFMSAAREWARKKGWAVGKELDACAAHHV